MRRTRTMTALMALALAGCSAAFAQAPQDPQAATQPPPPPPLPRAQASPAASVKQRIGPDTDVTITYNRPGVKGRKIWGELVPYGLAPANQYAQNPYPWRGGANATTTVEFSKAVKVQGKELPAGKYGLHFIPTEKDWTVIFSKNSTGFGSFGYKEEEDALRVSVTPTKAPFAEWLEYGFENLSAAGATCCLKWEELKVPFEIGID